MTFAELAGYLEKLEKISSRLGITALLAELFKKTAKEEIAKVCFLSLGRLGPLYEGVELNLAEKTVMRGLSRAFGVSGGEVESFYKKLGDLGEVAYALNQKSKIPAKGGSASGGKNQKLTVGEVFNKLLEIANSSGTGSQEKKLTLLAGLLKSVTPLSAKYLVRIILKKLRLGFSDKTLIEALSWMETGGKGLKNEIERAYFVYPNMGEIARRFKEGGLRSLKGLRPKVGVPVLPQLCQRIPTAAEVMEKMGEVTAEVKYDGTRVQLHLDRNRNYELGIRNLELDLGDSFKKPKYLVKTFTRNLEENTGMFPDLLAAADKQIKAESAILDGEAVGFDPQTGKMLPFQETVQRKRKHGVAEKAAAVPLRLYLFDLLYLNGESLLDQSLAERRRCLAAILKVSPLQGETLTRCHLTESEKITSVRQLEVALKKAHAQGLEGLVLKDPHSFYEAGSRGFAWVKFKREEGSDKESGGLTDTVDAVVLGYYKGIGKRTAFGIGAFLVGVFDEENDRFLTVAKVGTGLTDEQWREMRRRCGALKVKEPPKNVNANKLLKPDVWVTPQMVVVIRADEITRSPAHSAGYALRFPRLLDWREDKTAEQATTLTEFHDLYRAQKRDGTGD